MKTVERTVSAERVEDLISVFGSFDENIRRIEEELAVSIVNRGTELKVCGDEEAVDETVADDGSENENENNEILENRFCDACFIVLPRLLQQRR